MKKIFALVIVIAMVFTTLTGCGSSEKDFYSPENTDIRLRYFSDDYGVTPSNERIVGGDYNFFPNPEDYYVYYGEEIEIIKSQLIEFFDETYHVSIEDKLDLIETRIFSYYIDMNGYSVPGENIIYLNEYIIGGTLDTIAYTWAHEAIHSIGLDYFNNNYIGLYEAITEAVNHQFNNWAGYSLGSSLYWPIVPVGNMLITTNPDLVSNSISDQNFLIEEEIDKVLSNATYTEVEMPDGHSIAYQLSDVLWDFSVNYYDLTNDLFYVQAQQIKEISVAYCRTFNLTKQQVEEFKDLWISGTYNRVIF